MLQDTLMLYFGVATHSSHGLRTLNRQGVSDKNTMLHFFVGCQRIAMVWAKGILVYELKAVMLEATLTDFTFTQLHPF